MLDVLVLLNDAGAKIFVCETDNEILVPGKELQHGLLSRRDVGVGTGMEALFIGEGRHGTFEPAEDSFSGSIGLLGDGVWVQKVQLWIECAFVTFSHVLLVFLIIDTKLNPLLDLLVQMLVGCLCVGTDTAILDDDEIFS